jgi:hypothetical protein
MFSKSGREERAKEGNERKRHKLYAIHFRAYDQYVKTDPTYAQYYCLFIYLFCSSSPRHVSASNDAIMKGTASKYCA